MTEGGTHGTKQYPAELETYAWAAEMVE